MGKHTMITSVLVDETIQLTFIEVCHHHHIKEETLLDMLEQGLLADITEPHKNLVFKGRDLQRIFSACRLHRDLGINSPGVILALELLDELDSLNQQLQMLQRHIQES